MKDSTRAAQQIREILKKQFPKIKFSVTSKNFSMGDSIDVNWTAEIERDKVYSCIKHYQLGTFNGIDDTYEYSNVIDNIPQVTFLFCNKI